MSEGQRQNRKNKLVAAIAVGAPVAAWARENKVSRRTAYRWAKDPLSEFSHWARTGNMRRRIAEDVVSMADLHLLRFRACCDRASRECYDEKENRWNRADEHIRFWSSRGDRKKR
jgi:hypothetical protein